MSRRVVNLTLDNLPDVPDPCRSCVFWELDPVAGARATETGNPGLETEAWVSATVIEWSVSTECQRAKPHSPWPLAARSPHCKGHAQSSECQVRWLENGGFRNPPRGREHSDQGDANLPAAAALDRRHAGARVR